MNFPMAGAPGPEIVTQEKLLLDAAERIARIRDGRLAVHVHLSALRPTNRQEGHIRIALRMLEPMVNAYRGQMFLLGNSDIVFMVKDPNPTDVENMIFKLRALFSKDPLTYADSGDGRDNFCTWYDLGLEYEAFLAVSQKAASEAQRRQKAKAIVTKEINNLDAKSLGTVLERIATIDIAKLIRRQAAIAITHQGNAEVLFQEFFIAMSELQKALAPDINLLGNRWLFQHLSQTLDFRMLGALQSLKLTQRPPTYSLNLNISAVATKSFTDFEKSLPPDSRVSVELQVLDVLADSRGYYAARESLREKGHLVAIDGLNELTLRLMDLRQFDADLHKISWSPEMREAEHGDAVAAALMPVAPERLLLARCDSEAAITWGMNQGISRFQGRHVDAMLAAYTMHGCDKAAACTLAQCISRHGVVTGPLRNDCGNNQMLDSSPVMRVARPKQRQETL
ncbi:MAG TPA: hypothetical protein HPP80_03015 [Rhodospirillaceae bacterium]|nr:hypothetical protein [Rhodospirillaceae bacterium]